MSMNRVDDLRENIKTLAHSIRENLRSLHLEKARGLAENQQAQREANRFFGGVYNLLTAIETRSNTLDPEDLELLLDVMRRFWVCLDELKSATLDGTILTANRFRCDAEVRKFLKIRRHWFDWVSNDAPWQLKALRNLERDVVPNKFWLALVIIIAFTILIAIPLATLLRSVLSLLD